MLNAARRDGPVTYPAIPDKADNQKAPHFQTSAGIFRHDELGDGIVWREPLRVARFDALRPLLQKTAGGDADAFGKLYEALSPRVFGLALKILDSDRHAAEEATLETFLEVWQRAPRHISRCGNVTAWVLGIARRKSLDARGEIELLSEPSEAVASAAPLRLFPSDPGDTRWDSDRQWRARRVRRPR